LYRHLHAVFADVHVVNGNATAIKELATQNGYLAHGLVDAVVSGLGMLSMPREAQRSIMRAAFEVLKPEGRMIQFTYGPSNPIPRETLAELGLSVRRGGFAWWNVPPASVYVYTRLRSEAIQAVRTKG
jgi:phospholipid N-methyltransferase